VGTFAKLAGEKFAWMGAFVGLVTTAIMFYYSVVAGWAIFYFVETLTNPLPLTHQAAVDVWDGFQSGGLPVFFHALAMGVGAAIVWRGISSIERANKVLIPTLLVIVVLAVGYTFTLDGAWEGIGFLFTPDWSTLSKPSLWVEALTQNAWDTGAGWGLILTYGAYMQQRHGVVKNAVITGVGNNAVSLLAGTIIFGTVFATLGTEMAQGQVLSVMRESGPAGTGLTFIWMPQLFEQMPLGKILATLFFLGLSFAAFSSLISMIELATRVLVDFGVGRRRAVASVGAVGFLLGLPSAIWTGVLANQDFVWGVALIISGGLVAFAVLRFKAAHLRERFLEGVRDWDPGVTWDTLIGRLVPLQAVALLAWWLVSIYAPGTWYNPLAPSSLANFFVQWGIALALIGLLNRWMVRRMSLPENELRRARQEPADVS
jgi:NSS family neurotransmitter:Na+ symporter